MGRSMLLRQTRVCAALVLFAYYIGKLIACCCKHGYGREMWRASPDECPTDITYTVLHAMSERMSYRLQDGGGGGW